LSRVSLAGLFGLKEFTMSPIKKANEGSPSPVIKAATHPIYIISFSPGVAGEYSFE
jgi:hypothetical protein